MAVAPAVAAPTGGGGISSGKGGGGLPSGFGSDLATTLSAFLAPPGLSGFASLPGLFGSTSGGAPSAVGSSSTTAPGADSHMGWIGALLNALYGPIGLGNPAGPTGNTPPNVKPSTQGSDPESLSPLFFGGSLDAAHNLSEPNKLGTAFEGAGAGNPFGQELSARGSSPFDVSGGTFGGGGASRFGRQQAIKHY